MSSWEGILTRDGTCYDGIDSVKIREILEGRATNRIVHVKHVNDNGHYRLRVEAINAVVAARNLIKQGLKHDPDGGGDDEVEWEGEEDDQDYPIDPKSGLPIFPPFGKAELGVFQFVRARLIRLLRSESLWHHMTPIRDLVVKLVRHETSLCPYLCKER